MLPFQTASVVNNEQRNQVKKERKKERKISFIQRKKERQRENVFKENSQKETVN